MLRNAALIVIVATVLAVHLAFCTSTYHVSDVKTAVFVAGLAALAAALAARRLLGGEAGAPLWSGPIPRQVLGAVLAFALLSALSVAWAGYREAAAFRAVEIALFAAWAVLVVLALRTRRDVARVVDVFLIAGVATAAAAFALAPVFPRHAQQFLLPVGNSNWLAVAMLIPMMLCVEGFWRNAFGRERRALWAALYAVAFALMGTVVYLAESESSAAAFLIALVALPMLVRARRRWLLAGLIAAAIILAAGVDLTRGPHGKIRSFARSKSVEIRLDMWRWGLGLAKRNPALGLGAGGYFPNVGEVAAPVLDIKPGFHHDIEPHAHNELLEIFVELGVLGLAAFLWAIGASLWGVARLPRDDTGDGYLLRARVGAFAAGWLAVMLQSLLDVGMRFETVPVIFWTGLGVLVATLRLPPEGAPAAAEPRPAVPGARWKVPVVVIVLAAAAACLIVPMMRGAAAMKDALDEKSPEARLKLLRRAAADGVSFVDRVRSRAELGRQLAGAGSPRAASDQFRAVLRMAGFYHDTELLLAATLIDQDRVDEAMPHLRHYGNLRPADTRTSALLTVWLRKLPPEDAMRRVNALAKGYSDSSKLYVAAGRLALQFDPPDEESARHCFERALAVNPRDPQAAYLLGVERLKQSQYVEARRLIDEGYRGGLRSSELFVNLARLMRMVGDDAGARALLAEGARLFPDSEDIRKELDAGDERGD